MLPLSDEICVVIRQFKYNKVRPKQKVLKSKLGNEYKAC